MKTIPFMLSATLLVGIGFMVGNAVIKGIASHIVSNNQPAGNSAGG